ncbi:MAG: hypothetical protein RLZZ206_3223 [Cyanobacteriota bacterium]|jgi:hypothetical protein
METGAGKDWRRKAAWQITNSQQPSPGLAGMEGKDWGQPGTHPEEIGSTSIFQLGIVDPIPSINNFIES